MPIMMLAAALSASNCYDPDRKQPATLSGRLVYVMFAGPPNFEDVRRGDSPEPNYVLRLPKPICLRSGTATETGDAFTDVQVVETDATRGQLRPYVGKDVTVDLTDQTAAETGHHHEPLVAWVTAVRSGLQPAPMNFTDEYGTGATTVRAFYTALSDGQGGVASAMLVPEKRGSPAFTPAALAGFYGKLSEPLRIIDITQTGTSTFVAHYRYRAGTRRCDGRSQLTVVRRNGSNLIERVTALNGC